MEKIINHKLAKDVHESCLEFSDSNWFQIINTETALPSSIKHAVKSLIDILK